MKWSDILSPTAQKLSTELWKKQNDPYCIQTLQSLWYNQPTKDLRYTVTTDLNDKYQEQIAVLYLNDNTRDFIHQFIRDWSIYAWE